jgi:hypothetical protein
MPDVSTGRRQALLAAHESTARRSRLIVDHAPRIVLRDSGPRPSCYRRRKYQRTEQGLLHGKSSTLDRARFSAVGVLSSNRWNAPRNIGLQPGNAPGVRAARSPREFTGHATRSTTTRSAAPADCWRNWPAQRRELPAPAVIVGARATAASTLSVHFDASSLISRVRYPSTRTVKRIGTVRRSCRPTTQKVDRHDARQSCGKWPVPIPSHPPLS